MKQKNKPSTAVFAEHAVNIATNATRKDKNRNNYNEHNCTQ